MAVQASDSGGGKPKYSNQVRENRRILESMPGGRKKKGSDNPDLAKEYWGKGQSGYGSGKNSGTKHQNAAQRRATNNMSERNYTTYGGKERNKGQLASAKKEWKKNIAEVNKSGGGGHDRAGALTKANQDALFNYRLNRRLRGDFKGKYYGPDEFKGDEKKLSAWRAAGSPKDKSRFV